MAVETAGYCRLLSAALYWMISTPDRRQFDPVGRTNERPFGAPKLLVLVPPRPVDDRRKWYQKQILQPHVLPARGALVHAYLADRRQVDSTTMPYRCGAA